MTVCDAAFKQRIREMCYDALEANGFQRFQKEGVDWPINNNFNCWVGLNTGLYPDKLKINPFVGVHVKAIAKLKALCGRKYDRRVATYAVNMGELDRAKDEIGFCFTLFQSDELIKSECDRLALLYKTIGLEYAKSIATYENLLPLLKARVPMLGGYPESFACCLYLMGRGQEAGEFVEKFRVKEPSYFKDFSAAFLSILSSDAADK